MLNLPILSLSSTNAPVTVLQTFTSQPVCLDLPYGNFNLGLHVNDNPIKVHENRANLLQNIQKIYPKIQRIHWLNQVHGDAIYHVTDEIYPTTVCADAHITTNHDVALAIMTADCVPIMITSQNGDVIGAIHAGWQGLAKGIIHKIIQKMAHQVSIQTADLNLEELTPITENWQAWIGACIQPQYYEVDEKVKNSVLSNMAITHEISQQFFIQQSNKPLHYLANLPLITEYQLKKCGINTIIHSGLDSFSDSRFYSYRQQTQANQPYTGRMATLILRH